MSFVIVKTEEALYKSEIFERFSIQELNDGINKYTCRDCGWSVELKTRTFQEGISEYTYQGGITVPAIEPHWYSPPLLVEEALSLLRDHMLTKIYLKATERRR